MAEGTSIREHCLKMITNQNILDVLGDDIDGESQDILNWTAVRFIILQTTVKWIINLTTSIYINS